MDIAKNAAKCTVSTTYDASATSVVLTTGHGARLPSTPFNLVWWNSTDYSDPVDDPNFEIVRCVAISTDTLTIERAQEGTSASTKNTASKTYKMSLAPTADGWNTGNPRIGLYILDHFLGVDTSLNFGDTRWRLTASGTGSPGMSEASLTIGDNHQGVVRIKTGTATNGFAVMAKGPGVVMYFGQGEWFCEWCFYINNLADATDDYILRVGFGDSLASATDHTDGAYFEYDRSTSANWRCVTASATTRTKTSTSTAVAATTWIRLGVRVNAAGNSVKFYINGTLVHTETTNIPTGSTRVTNPSFWLNKTAGTTERNFMIDYFELINTFTTQVP